jgi:hypothetical protein
MTDLVTADHVLVAADFAARMLSLADDDERWDRPAGPVTWTC